MALQKTPSRNPRHAPPGAESENEMATARTDTGNAILAALISSPNESDRNLEAANVVDGYSRSPALFTTSPKRWPATAGK